MPDVTSPPAATVAPARRCAYAVLRRVFERGAYADRALTAEAAELDPRDRALAMRLAYGAVQRAGTLDHVIEGLSERPAAQLDPPLLEALRLGLYELLYLRGAPDYAVVADAVELAKTHARAGHGLVNAVLRRATREGADALLGALGDDTPERAAVKHSHPEWIARLWWQIARGRAGARADGRRQRAAGGRAACEHARHRRGHARGRATRAHAPRPRDPRGARAGGAVRHPRLAVVAERRVPRAVARGDARRPRARPAPGERVLDLCAAPGGKSTHLAALMQGRGEVLAVERNRRRAGGLVRTARRLHAANVRVEVADAEHERAEGAVFDRVLVDPPCSGLGTLQARADLRWRVTPAAIEQMTHTQAQILTAGAAALRPGGMLVYSTCTISPTENERLIAAFLDSHTEFELDDLAGTAGAQPVAEAPGMLQTLPHRDRTAGFFIARLRKR